MKKVYFAIVLSLMLLIALVGPAAAVTDGQLDGEGHPHVVLILMEVGGEPMYRCSGTLISPYTVLTAGHCTSNYPDEPFSGMRVYIESDVQNGDNNYPYAGPNAVEAESWFAHPLFETTSFIYHDVGVINLKDPIYLDTYGTLPTVNQFDALKTKRGLKDTTFTAVGYGLQASFPAPVSYKDVRFKVRMVAYPNLLQINVPGSVGDFSMLLSNNAHTGGTCFGDSGGPNFFGDTNIVAGVTSFGKNGNCAGTGGVFRMDRQNVLDFVNSHLK